MTTSREVQESPFIQGPNERLAYAMTTTLLGSSPSNVVVTLQDITDEEDISDVTVSLAPGVAGVVGDVITSPYLSGLTAGSKYRLSLRFSDANGNIWEEYAVILCQ